MVTQPLKGEGMVCKGFIRSMAVVMFKDSENHIWTSKGHRKYVAGKLRGTPIDYIYFDYED